MPRLHPIGRLHWFDHTVVAEKDCWGHQFFEANHLLKYYLKNILVSFVIKFNSTWKTTKNWTLSLIHSARPEFRRSLVRIQPITQCKRQVATHGTCSSVRFDYKIDWTGWFDNLRLITNWLNRLDWYYDILYCKYNELNIIRLLLFEVSFLCPKSLLLKNHHQMNIN